MRLEVSERERKRVLASLAEVSERAAALEQQLHALGDEQQRRPGEPELEQAADADGEAATLLIAVTRAAEDVRRASRAHALQTLTKARDQAARLRTEAESERAALAETQARREQAEREADEILARARAEAERERAALVETQERRKQAECEADEILAQARAAAGRVAVSVEDERRRVRGLLAGALATLESEGSAPTDDLMTDLSSRLNDPTDANGA